MAGLAGFYVANRARFTLVGTGYNCAMRSACQFLRHVTLPGFSVRFEPAGYIVRPNVMLTGAAIRYNLRRTKLCLKGRIFTT